jgi:hypothetical protein
MMVRGGELFVAPGNTTSLARTRLLGVRDKANLAAVLTRLPKLDPAELADLTVDAWVDQLTDRPRVRQVLHTVIRLTTYVDAPEHLSAEVAVTQLRTGLGDGVLYLDRGWQQLVDRLAATPGVTIEAGEPVNDLDDLADRIDGDVGGPGGVAVIVAAGGPRAVAAITGHPYESGPEATAAVLDLGLAAPPRHPFVLGVDESMYLSDHGLAAEMVPAGRASVSLARYHHVADGDDGERDTATDATAHLADRERLRGFATHAGITADQILEERYLHRMTVVSSIATAGSGGLAGRPPVSVPDRPGVFVAGDWVGPRGHLGDAVLASASDAARAAIAHLSRRAALR